MFIQASFGKEAGESAAASYFIGLVIYREGKENIGKSYRNI